MTYEYTDLGTAEANEQTVEVVQARVNGHLAKWMLAGAGIGAGYLLVRWLKDQKPWQRNPMPWSTTLIDDGYWEVYDERTGETVGYVLRMDGYFSAHTAGQAVIGTMPTMAAAEGLVYGKFYEKFAGATTMVDIPVSNPNWRLETFVADKMMRLFVDGQQIASLTRMGPDAWSISSERGTEGPFPDPDSAAQWLIGIEEAKSTVEKLKKQERRRLVREESEEEEIRTPDEELDHRIIITLYRSKVKGKTYESAPSGVEYKTPQQLHLPKKMTAAEIAKKVKSTEHRVLNRARTLARARKIYGISGYRKVDVPTTRVDSKGRKVMTFKKVRRKVTQFASFGPAGEVGFFAAGEYKLPDENPSQSVLEFGEKRYEVRERKTTARSTSGRMRRSKWIRVGTYDTLSAAMKATKMWHPPQTRREFRKQRAIFLDNKRVSDGDRLLPKYRDLPEQP